MARSISSRGARNAARAAARRPSGAGSRPAIDLAVRGERERVEHRERGGHHVVGQAFLEERAQLGHRGRGPDRAQITREAPVSRTILSRDHHRLRHRRMRGQHRLDLAELDAEAAHLDLLIGPPEELQRAVLPAADHVAGAVEPPARRRSESVHEESLRGQLRPAEVAAGDARAADEELAGHADRHRLARRVEHVEPGVGDRPPDRDGAPRPVEPVGGRPDGGLGRPVDVPHRRSGGDEPRGQVRAAAPRRRRGRAAPPRAAIRASSSIRQVAGVACTRVAPASAKSRHQLGRVGGACPDPRSPPERRRRAAATARARRCRRRAW